MNDQLSIFEEPITDEASFGHALVPHLDQIILTNNDDSCNITYRKNKTYSALLYKGAVVCQYKFGKKVNWVSFPLRLQELIPDQYTQRSASNGFIKIYLQNLHEAQPLIPVIAEMLDRMIDISPKAYSCCARYLECSTAGHCIEENKGISTECRYKINLKHGMNFYKGISHELPEM